MSQDDPVAAFRAEAGEVLDQTEQALLDLGQRLSDKPLINAVFRGLHTVKGSGAMFGFDDLAAFTHYCETAFDQIRKDQVPCTDELVAVILRSCDHMRALLAGTAQVEAGEELLAELSFALQMALEDTAAPAAPATDGWRLRFWLAPEAMAHGTNPLALLAELGELGTMHVRALTDRLPPLAELDPTCCHIGWEVTLEGDIEREAIDEVFLFVLDDMELEVEPLGCNAPVAAEVEHAPPAAAASEAPAAGAAAESVRVPADRLDELMNRVGELVIAQSRLAQIASHSDDIALRSVSEEIERLSGDLRTTMMVLRMVPVAQLFGRFRRLIHDLAHQTGKQIQLVTEGEGTEVDKTVAERLFDPIVHIIRNSCDHGLEDSAERAAAGKPATGTIRLAAAQSGGQVVLTITDDGAGIHVERVRAKAEAQGLIEPGAVLSDSEICQLIFHPGFSTAAQITNLSGRGVGMDVVKRTIEGLRGSIDVATKPGQGTTITLRIPLTLAIIEGLQVRVGEGRFILPLSAVEECIELSLEDDMRSRGRSLLTLRDRLIPFLRLRDTFATGTRPDPFQKVVVVASGEARVGLVVDQIIGSHQTVIKSMSVLHKQAAAFAGATILGDGTVALILDIGHLLATATPKEERPRAVGMA